MRVFMDKVRQMIDVQSNSPDVVWQQWRIDTVTHALRYDYYSTYLQSRTS